MSNVVPISELSNYDSVLQEVSVGSPVYLTKNGRECYAIVDISEQEENEKIKAELRLMCELQAGRKSGEEDGWLTEDEVKNHFFRIDKQFVYYKSSPVLMN